MRFLNLDERKYIEEQLPSGKSLSEIARELNRAKNIVITEVRRNGGRENYNADKSHKEALRRRPRHGKIKIIALKKDLTDEQVKLIYTMWKNGKSMYQIEEKFNISYSRVQEIIIYSLLIKNEKLIEDFETRITKLEKKINKS